jgi:N-acetylneuraminic acid mutarotase
MKARIGRGKIVSRKVVTQLVLVGLTGALSACPGNTPTYPVGGHVSGLSTNGLMLANGSDTLRVSSNETSFVFSTWLAAGTAYSVTIQAQPAGQTCLVSHGTGMATSVANIDVTISCTGPWTWMGGAAAKDAAGVYGTRGIAAAGNVPGARESSMTWTDSAGNFWLFGGTYFDANGDLFFLNDLWRYTPSNGLWTWISGSKVSGALYGTPGIYGVQGTASPNSMPGSRASAASWMDTAGNLWLFGGFGYDSANLSYLNDLWKYSPVTGEWTWVSGSNTAYPAASYGTLGTAAPSNVPDGRDEAASWIDSADNLWLFGGNSLSGFHNDLWKFTPSTNQWTWVSGANTPNGVGVYGTQGSSATANVPGSRFAATSWIDTSGNFWLFGGDGVTNPQTSGLLNDLWMFSPATNQWTWVTADRAAAM